MLTLPMESLTDAVNICFWPFVRLLALFHAAPVFSEKGIDRKTKIGLALLVTLLVAGELPPQPVPLFSLNGLWLALRQLVIGVAMGFSIQFMFVAVRIAGEVIGLQMGLSFATFFDPSSGSMPIIARLLNVLVTLLFLTFNGHLWMLRIVTDSFVALPINDAPFNGQIFLWLSTSAAAIFASALMLCLPVMIVLLCINLTLGVLNRFTPQLSIFVVGFPLTLTSGLVALWVITGAIGPWFEALMGENFARLVLLVQGLR
ncbi:flagellar biosynthetic protein FliR [Pantoea dispersa]|uniref:flagellar biosynthetic protein FliR n=1 Tax=Pantoea dispersa TaxID=59814 RepID=UPI000FDB5177|nr:flagellar biosynthetic protein FliR [Pantoea dispersa]RVU75222.1 flagellar biosynthetic protein FliR [Pantoea dispersa]